MPQNEKEKSEVETLTKTIHPNQPKMLSCLPGNNKFGIDSDVFDEGSEKCLVVEEMIEIDASS